MEDNFELKKLEDDEVELTMNDIEDNSRIEENKPKVGEKIFIIKKIIFICFTIIFAGVLGSCRYLIPIQNRFENISTAIYNNETKFIMQIYFPN
jgi:hypothetical protein